VTAHRLGNLSVKHAKGAYPKFAQYTSGIELVLPETKEIKKCSKTE
jgi:hypothetical protein